MRIGSLLSSATWSLNLKKKKFEFVTNRNAQIVIARKTLGKVDAYEVNAMLPFGH